MSKRLSIIDMQMIAKRQGGACLSSTYVTAHTSLFWQCSEGHTWSAKPNSVKNNKTWCPFCQGRGVTIEDMRDLANKRGGKCLSLKYKNNHTKLLWECANGHKWKTQPLHIKHSGSWCPHCAGKAQHTIERMHALARERGGKCLSLVYVNTNTKMHWECVVGHRWKATPLHIMHSRSWCPTCGYVNRSTPTKKDLDHLCDLAAKHGGQCISTEYAGMTTNHHWRCAEGHEWLAVPAHVQNDHWCPYCNSKGVRENLVRTILETMFNTPFPGERPLWLRNSRGNRMEFDGLSKTLGLAFEYHGEQHYHRSHYHATNTDLRRRIADDGEKEALCITHGVHLIVVPYFVCDDKLWSFLVSECTKHGFVPIRTSSVNVQELRSNYFRDRLSELRNIAQKHGGQLHAAAYLGTHVKYEWQCRRGHKWETTAKSVKKGTWCPQCGNIHSSTKRSLTIQDMRNAAIAKGGKCISAKYVNNKTKLVWECVKGHKWEATPHDVRAGCWCPECAGKKEYTILDMHMLANKKGGKCLSKEYVNSQTKLLWKCGLGHKWEARPAAVKHRTWCPICGRKTSVMKKKIASSKIND